VVTNPIAGHAAGPAKTRMVAFRRGGAGGQQQQQQRAEPEDPEPLGGQHRRPRDRQRVAVRTIAALTERLR
jgi:hypothetical protein